MTEGVEGTASAEARRYRTSSEAASQPASQPFRQAVIVAAVQVI